MQTKLKALQLPDPAVRIRPVQQGDLNHLMRTCWTDRSPDVGRWMLSRVVRNQQDRRGTGVVTLDADSEIVGYGQLTLWSRCAEISDLFVSQSQRSQGYGTAIIQYLVQEAARLRATCIEIGAARNNVRAIALYHQLGFVDHREVQMNLGAAEREPVIYMKIQLQEPT